MKEFSDKKIIAIDTETESLTDKTMVAFSYYDGKERVVVPIKMKTFTNVTKSVALSLIKNLILNNKVIFHNASFDIPVLLQYGVPANWFTDIEDTVIIANLVDENMQHGLKPLVKKFFKYQMTEFKDICGAGKKRIPFKEVPWKTAKKYAGEDAYYTYRLYKEVLLPLLKNDSRVYNLYMEIEKPLVKIVAMMHYNGITIDKKCVSKIAKDCQEKVDLSLAKLSLLIGPEFEDLNFNSPKQLRKYFIDKLNMPVLKTSAKTKQPSVDKEVLKVYAETNQEAKALLEYRKYSKILGTFIPALTPIGADKIYASFNQAGTVSGRFSSSRPNMQNIPQEDDLGIRAAIIPNKGHILIGADYGQIELRVLAHFSKDSNLINAYNTNTDIHQITADACGISRHNAKTVNFGIVYGMGAKTLSKRIDSSVNEAQDYIEKYFKTYPKVLEFWRETEKQIRETGYVETLMGRKRRRTQYFFQKDEYDQGAEVRSMINSIIQGSASDILKLAMVNIGSKLDQYGAHIILTCHDELLVSTPLKHKQKVYDLVKKEMLNAGKDLVVPVEISIKLGNNWMEAHG